MLQTFPKSETKRDVCHVGGKVPPPSLFFSLYCVVNQKLPPQLDNMLWLPSTSAFFKTIQKPSRYVNITCSLNAPPLRAISMHLSPRLQSNHSHLKLLQACHDKRLHQASNHQFHATHEKIPIKINQKSKHRRRLSWLPIPPPNQHNGSRGRRNQIEPIRSP
jgi:hypothetical protein